MYIRYTSPGQSPGMGYWRYLRTETTKTIPAQPGKLTPDLPTLGHGALNPVYYTGRKYSKYSRDRDTNRGGSQGTQHGKFAYTKLTASLGHGTPIRMDEETRNREHKNTRRGSDQTLSDQDGKARNLNMSFTHFRKSQRNQTTQD